MVFGLFHHVLSGPICVFFMVSNRELPCGVFPSGTRQADGGNVNHANKRSATKKKPNPDMFQPPTYRCTLNSITPLPALLSWLRIENPPRLFSHSITPASLCDTHTLLLSSFVVFAIGRPLHEPLRQPLNLKDPSKAILLLSSCSHSQLIKVR